MVYPARCFRPGFTIPELLVVLLVVGLLGLLVVPRMEITRFRMDGSTRGFAAALVAAQRVAVKRQHDVVVAFDTVARHLRIHEDQDNDRVIDAGERVRQVPLTDDVVFGLGSAPPREPDAPVVSFTEAQDGLPAVRFIRNGSASAQGTFYLTSSRAMRDARFAGDTRALEVSRSTGRVAWYYFDPPEWKQGF